MDMSRACGSSSLVEGYERDALSQLARRTGIISIRNALYGALGRILLGFVKVLAKSGLRKDLSKLLMGEIFSLNPLKWGFFFLGLSSFRLLQRAALSSCPLLPVSEKISYLIAGCLCSLPVLAMKEETKTELCAHAFVRALRALTSRHVLHLLPRRLREFKHYDIAVMCMSSSQILYAFVFAPYTLPDSYRMFLSKTSMIDERVVRSYAGLVRHRITPELVDLCMEKGREVPWDSDVHLNICCSCVHNGLTCNQFSLSLMRNNIIQVGLPLYLPLKILTFVIFKYKKMMREPSRSLYRATTSLVSSTLFLALYSVFVTRYACFTAQRNIRGGLLFALVSSLVGIVSFLEPKGRRVDLATYCFMFAIRSFVLTQYRFGRLPCVSQSGIFPLYFTSIAFLFFLHDHEPAHLDSRSRFVMKMVSCT
uniref:Uncharacterized protein TCIL3000_10_11670 n=1 Tax=Trypanosoma congolense (strain IL3000) TaxID=1068625 RepID=G0UYB9_TRYCI|nr:unnamed protein product [Trypanosoma congolense IL3000]